MEASRSSPIEIDLKYWPDLSKPVVKSSEPNESPEVKEKQRGLRGSVWLGDGLALVCIVEQSQQWRLMIENVRELFLMESGKVKRGDFNPIRFQTVSYTHLTLPTKA